MSDYIERENAKHAVWGCTRDTGIDEAPFEYAEGLLENVPSADVAPVRHGRWEKTITYFSTRCTGVRCAVRSFILKMAHHRRTNTTTAQIAEQRWMVRMSDMAMKYEDWLRGCVHHDGRKGNVYLPCDRVLAIADWIEAHRDVAPVRHGRWDRRKDKQVCSLCGAEWYYFENDVDMFGYCPHCGARKDGDSNETDRR